MQSGSELRWFVNEPMLCSIQKFTINHGEVNNENFSVELRELEKFIGLQIALVVLVGKNNPSHQLWGKE